MRLKDKVAVVTGGAQGFGAGIAQCLSGEGASVVIADLKGGVITDVTKEEDVKRLCDTVLEQYGRLDIFISNAGILKAGGLEEMSLEDFELVAKVNYTAFFLCAKAAARVMKAQREQYPERMFDIIQINSKSGLEGSNKNFAYAGSKFGGIGLVQSFALELAAYGIKVNAVCPGNYFEGPLWADPERGLFAQYLNAGKVPGAETVEDVKAFYEAKVPMGRGCAPEDVARAILYCIEQQYETGQAIPVTGGQVMLS
ncbi:MAG: SDR family oxidoreductase [Oscillospiraceae bacterium]|jgi:NAD(P)-dependent dehydrogenase (short-subunit alcohol dehydrogenase family)|nr:SDR family oxidoreductase [Oscillospiraceae bacterium]